MKNLKFELAQIKGEARLGKLKTPHGSFETPVFMPVGTLANVKAVMPKDLWGTGSKICLANAYHLYLRPGAQTVADAGGLHRFMGWEGAILTDSGGFQIMSLGKNVKVEDAGVSFRSHIDGREICFTPEISIGAQTLLGADIIMAFDHLIPYPSDYSTALDATKRTLFWARRCRNVEIGEHQSLFGIVQGSIYPDLRQRCAKVLGEMDFAGYGLGGFSVGEPKSEFYDGVSLTTECLPKAKPRYLMGVGHPADLVNGVLRGVDMFDCVLPTRNARHGRAFTFEGYYNLKSAGFKDDLRPIEEGCDCAACKSFSRAYLRHLFNSRETLSWTLLSIHNLRFFQRLMEKIRGAVAQDSLQNLRRQIEKVYPIE